MKTHRNLKALSILVCISVLLTGCGSSTSSKGASVGKTVNINSDFTFMSDFLDALEANGVSCTGYVKDDEVIGVREQGNCTYASTELTLDLFADEKTAKTMTESLKAFGGYWVVSNNWVIVVQDGEIAKDLQGKLNAQIA